MLSAPDLAHFRGRLLQREAQLRRELQEMQQRCAGERFAEVAGEVADSEDAALAELVAETNQAEIGRDAAELREVQQALGRLEAGSYGICQRCGEPIERGRLDVFPAAKYDLRHQEEEEHRLRVRAAPKL
jgi:RNA polymerase-binding transcription factor DksA